mgnify:CR=1 FL=1
MAPFSAKQHHELRSLGFTLAALMLLIPTYLYPFMTMLYAGQAHKTTIWDGIKSLYEGGMWGTATIVFMASIIIPIFKLLALFFIILTEYLNIAFNARTSLLALVDFIGRWSMLDVFLVSIMVALIKFGDFATVSAGIASYLLGIVVICTMLASASLSECYKEPAMPCAT